ncbi:hypothetical protein RHECNPAF_1700017 [Rhizobium etli CNPAF512]|nr:hypothetical protein RHECNPAF_1700017 [Rhizobium etli CNPAF512]
MRLSCGNSTRSPSMKISLRSSSGIRGRCECFTDWPGPEACRTKLCSDFAMTAMRPGLSAAHAFPRV